MGMTLEQIKESPRTYLTVEDAEVASAAGSAAARFSRVRCREYREDSETRIPALAEFRKRNPRKGMTMIDILQKTGILVGIAFVAWSFTPQAYKYPRRRKTNRTEVW